MQLALPDSAIQELMNGWLSLSWRHAKVPFDRELMFAWKNAVLNYVNKYPKPQRPDDKSIWNRYIQGVPEEIGQQALLIS